MRTRHFMRRMACLLVVCLLASCLFALSGCSAPAPVERMSYGELMAMMNQPLEGDVLDLVDGSSVWPLPPAYNGRLWAASVRRAPQQDGFVLDIYSVGAAGDDLTELSLPLEAAPQAAEKQEQLRADYPQAQILYDVGLTGPFFDADGALHVLLSDDVRAVSEDGYEVYETASFERLFTVDEAGALHELPTPQLPEGWRNTQGCFFGPDGRMWLYGAVFEGNASFGVVVGTRFLCYAPEETEPELVWETQQNLGVLQPLPDGRLAALSSDHGSNDIYLLEGLDTDTPALSEPMAWELETEMSYISGLGKDLTGEVEACLYGWNGQGIYRYDLARQSSTQLLSFDEFALEGSVFDLAVLPQGRYMVMLRDDEWANHVRVLRPATPEEMEGLPTLSLGLFDTVLPDVAEAVARYNALDPPMYIRLVDYSAQGAEAAGYDSPEEQLQNDLMAGNVPDILLLGNGTNNNTLFGQGLFVDLYPLLDADAQLQRSDFIPGVLAACEFGGTLPTLAPAYTIVTAVGSAEVCGGPGMTWADYQALCAAWPDAVPLYGADRNTGLLYLLQMGGSRFVDYAAGQAHLDTPDFVQLLQASADWPVAAASALDDPKPILSDHGALLRVAYLGDWRSILTWEYEFNGPVVFTGFPSDEGSGSAIAPLGRIGITQYCTDVQAAWAFVRTLLLPEYQEAVIRAHDLPLRADTLAAGEAQAQLPDEETYPPYYLTAPYEASRAEIPQEILQPWQRALTAQEAASVTQLINSVDTMYQYDSVLTDIVFEEAQAFYNGQRTAQQAAAIMQARVQTWLDEQSTG